MWRRGAINTPLVSRARSLTAVLVLVSGAACAPFAPTPDAAHSRTYCLATGEWALLDAGGPRLATPAEIGARFAQSEVVLLGERHNSAEDHAWQLRAIELLRHERRRLTAPEHKRQALVLGFEAFPRRVQPVLDRWVAGTLTERQFLDETAWDRVWKFPADLYLPLFRYARVQGVPIAALNIEREFTRAVAKGGWESVPEAQREGVGRPAPAIAGYVDELFEFYREHSSAAHRKEAAAQSDRDFLNFVEAQTTWDRAMAEALAQAARRPEHPLVIGILGAGHVRHGHGVAHQLRALGIERIGSLLTVEAESRCEELKPGLADAVYVLPRPVAELVPTP